MRAGSVVVFGLGVAFAVSACGHDPRFLEYEQGHAPDSTGVAGGTSVISLDGGSSSAGKPGTSGGTAGMSFELPAEYTPARTGGFKLNGPVAEGSRPAAPANCSNELTGIVRDFKGGPPDGHPDFEMDIAAYRQVNGLVKPALASDRKPAYAPQGPTDFTTGAEAFDEWYRSLADQPHQNQPFYLTLFLVPDETATYVFRSDDFFPLDGQGFGNQGRDHNFHFTFELHTTFTYRGGERFTFVGDDDVFVFVNNHLAVDLGGVHDQFDGTVRLDQVAVEFGLVKGGTYTLEMFHAERHTSGSTFRIETTIEFATCDEFVPDVRPPR
jgi:fibro-slime domain-containing protein